MTDENREFEYIVRMGMVRLLAVLMAVLSPVAMYFSFDTGNTFHLFGIVIPNAVGCWLVRLLALALLVGGALMVKGASQQEKARQRIILTATSFIFPDAGVGGIQRTIDYNLITNISSSRSNNRQYLHFTAPGGKVTISSRDMESMQQFEEMCALLEQRVHGGVELAQ